MCWSIKVAGKAGFFVLIFFLSFTFQLPKKLSPEELIASFPQADTSQILHPVKNIKLAYKKVKLKNSTKDAWILAPEDYLLAQGDFKGELGLSLGFLKSANKKSGIVAKLCCYHHL